MSNVVKACIKGEFQKACDEINILFDEGYNIIDLINTLTRVMQTMNDFKTEELRLNYLKEASIIKMRTLEGNNSKLQLHGFLGKLCMMSSAQNIRRLTTS